MCSCWCVCFHLQGRRCIHACTRMHCFNLVCSHSCICFVWFPRQRMRVVNSWLRSCACVPPAVQAPGAAVVGQLVRGDAGWALPALSAGCVAEPAARRHPSQLCDTHGPASAHCAIIPDNNRSWHFHSEFVGHNWPQDSLICMFACSLTAPHASCSLMCVWPAQLQSAAQA